MDQWTNTFTKLGHPFANASIPSSETGQPLIHRVFKATHLAAMQEISGSPTESLPHKANRSRFWQLDANIYKLALVGLALISTNSSKLGQPLATLINPSSRIRFAFHPSM
ncbi:hypothetical protein VIGAN_02172400 [Vigna angularis var. angularis]|uniref:Uncharacterized protein n=1 Tax=Vigna angularis var. angularis TaxID=157739 RepID=A0A0S3REN3_PHAAN|nr:hypothetical protein VIGAN_02172400 [Vigna angularis var. angularis]